jgi:hypothetical protein
MKSVERKTVFISAYPLKALNLPEEEYQSELNLWVHSHNEAVDDLRILPMVNPYREKDFIPKINEDHTEK